MTVHAAGATDVGQVRTLNEDSLAVLLPPDIPAALEALLVVADGMGGHQAGEVASSLAVQAVVETISRCASAAQAQASSDEILGWLRSAFGQANRRVFEAASGRPELQGMGTTCTAVAVRGGELAIGHVGDSRAYLIRNGQALQLTEDHSWVAERVRAGELTAEEAGNHPRRNLLLRALGPRPEVNVDVFACHPAATDWLLLCSDGLTSMVRESQIGRIISNAPDQQQTCDELIAAANEHGGLDNVTVIVATFDADL